MNYIGVSNFVFKFLKNFIKLRDTCWKNIYKLSVTKAWISWYYFFWIAILIVVSYTALYLEDKSKFIFLFSSLDYEIISLPVVVHWLPALSFFIILCFLATLYYLFTPLYKNFAELSTTYNIYTILNWTKDYGKWLEHIYKKYDTIYYRKISKNTVYLLCLLCLWFIIYVYTFVNLNYTSYSNWEIIFRSSNYLLSWNTTSYLLDNWDIEKLELWIKEYSDWDISPNIFIYTIDWKKFDFSFDNVLNQNKLGYTNLIDELAIYWVVINDNWTPYINSWKLIYRQGSDQAEIQDILLDSIK
jgi:hypothetical protein